MFRRGKIFTAYEKPEASEPTDRVELVPEGFSTLALFFNVLWLWANRLWLASIIYFAAVITVFILAEKFSLPHLTVILLQLFVQLNLAFTAYDWRRAKLVRHGYRFAGVIVADSYENAERRYYEHAA